MLDVMDVKALDRVFQAIMTRMVATGQAPHHAELAPALGCTTEEARQAVHAIFRRGYPGWVHPGTDLIASFPPLNSLPTQYRISVGDARKWFAQCGFEALATCWLFPGRTVRVEASCLDCAAPMVLELRDGRLETVDPPTIVGHCNSPWSLLADPKQIPFM
jgi:alkylmercury lyase-like protein